MYKSLQSSIRSSEKHALVSDFAARVWMHGLAQSDFFGRLPASVAVFRAEAMPLFNARSDEEINAALHELDREKLIHLYTVGGKAFMVFHDHEEHNGVIRNLRNIRPQYPTPPRLCPCIQYAQHEKPTSSFIDDAEKAVTAARAKRPREIGADPKEAIHVGLMRLAIDTAQCPSAEGTMRKYVAALCARSDVGAQKLEQYLMSPEALGKTVNDWQDHFRAQGKRRGDRFEEVDKLLKDGGE